MDVHDEQQFQQSQAARAIMDAYIGGGLQASAAALQLTAPITCSLLSASDGKDAEGWLWSIWGTLMCLVRTIAYNDPALDALVTLLAAIKEVPMPTRTPASAAFESTWGFEFWQDLPVFGPTVREDWNGITDDHPELLASEKAHDRFYSRGQWASMNALVARLSATHVSDFSMYGIWTMRDTFEEVLSAVGLDNHVPAAAVWVLDAGGLMYDLAQKAQPPDWIGNASRGGPLWKGRSWYSLERWACWKEGFRAAMGRSDLDSWTQEMAERAHQQMGHLEQQGTM